MLEMELNLNILQLFSLVYFCVHVFSFCHNTLVYIGSEVFYSLREHLRTHETFTVDQVLRDLFA